MKRKTQERKKFYTENQFIVDPLAPVVGGEFVIPDAKEGDLAQGQTVEVKSQKTLEDDHGTGEPIIIRTFEFGVNPQTFKEFQKRNGRLPTQQELFNDHKKGIAGMLWQDGMTPAEDIEPRVIFAKGQDKYLIMVGARPSLGQSVLERPKTLSEIVNDSSTNPNKVHRKL